MIVKFLAHGRGSGARAAAYLVGELDHKGEVRAGVEVLRGNPAMLGELIDSLSFVERYTSGVLAWHHDDEPTGEEIEQALDEFEALAFAGLPPERRAWSAVRHIEADGSTHVHVVIARVDLGTGRSFNPAPPGWEPGYNLMRDALNAHYGWASPDAPEHRRVVSQPERLGAPPPGGDPREWLTSALTLEVSQGRVIDRAGVVKWLAGMGQITRTGRDYVSVKLAGDVKAVRLKGTLYREDFSPEALASDERARAAAKRPAPDPEAERLARLGLAEVISKRAAYNVQRYCTPGVRERKRLERAEALAAASPTLTPPAAAAAVLEPLETPRHEHDGTGATAHEAARRDVEAASVRDSAVDRCCRAVERLVQQARRAVDRALEALRNADAGAAHTASARSAAAAETEQGDEAAEPGEDESRRRVSDRGF